MFTGLVECMGQKVRVEPFLVRVPLTAPATRSGDSVALNGCCLTLLSEEVFSDHRIFRFDLSPETQARTNLGQAEILNMEWALQVGSRLGGHWVTGHIDCCGRVSRLERDKNFWNLEIETPSEFHRQFVPKGSVAMDGISLTVNHLTQKGFDVTIIPHTFQKTNIQSYIVGQKVNIETDILGKYVIQRLETQADENCKRS